MPGASMSCDVQNMIWSGSMNDLVFLGLGLGLFAVVSVYAHLCARL